MTLFDSVLWEYVTDETEFLSVDGSLRDELFMDATFSLTANLKPEVWTFCRHVYVILAFIGNVGGLSDGLKLLVSFGVLYYNGIHFDRLLAGKLFKA